MGAAASGRLKNFFHYETVQIVRIRNVRVSLIYHFAQLIILGYIIGYGLIYKKAYQASGQVIGSADIKVKGVGYVNQSLPWYGPKGVDCYANDTCFHIYDSYDLVMPPMEADALFVTSNMWVTKNQTRSVCPSYTSDNNCTVTKCQKLKSVTGGRQTGIGDNAGCVTDYIDPLQVWPDIIPKGSYCMVYGWCPTELEITNRTRNTFYIKGVNDFTVFVRMNVNYPKFGITVDNTGDSDVPTAMNLWTLEDMINQSGWDWELVRQNGTMLAMNARWDCDFDHSIDECIPAITFVRLDDPTSKLSSGFNFRSVEFMHDKLGSRQVTKHYGIRLLVLISGVGSKFDWVALLTAIGAGIGLLSVATLIADFIATNLLQNKDMYRGAKYKEVDVADEDSDEEDKYKPPRKRTRDGDAQLQIEEGDEDASEESWGVARYPTK